jgi:hypothetical protein
MAPPDSIPTVWKSPSLLGLENRFVTSGLPRLDEPASGIRVNADPRTLAVSLDPETGELRVVPELGEVPVGEAKRIALAEFSAELTRRNFQRMWADRSRASLNTIQGGAATTSGTGLSFQFPSPLPKRIQNLLGPGGPALNVYGSESIKLSGQSDWSNEQVGQIGQRRSLFPSLDMQQDLDIRLEGQLSDRIRVNLLQNSANQIPLANRIAINYKGDEDDLVQALDLGNTNLALPGTQYVSYSGRNEGLFGMKATTRMGPLDLTVLASKQEGKSERASYAGGASRQSQSLADFDYVKGVYFFLYDPNGGEIIDISDPSIEVFLDEGITTTQIDFVRGRGFVDPVTALRDSSGVGPGQFTPSVRGNFKKLLQGATLDYEILNNVYGQFWKVIRLRRPLTGEQRLAVSYLYRQVGPGGPVGDTLRVGGLDEPDTDGATARTMKLLRLPLALLPVGADQVTFDDDAPFAPVRQLELKNFYQLPGQRIDDKTFKLQIRRGVGQPPITFVRRDPETVPYTEILGLDNVDERNGFPVEGHDDVIDGTGADRSNRTFVDYENGTLFLPDLRPFAPRIGANGLPFDQAISDTLNRRDALVGPPDADNAANPAIYDRRNFDRQTDVRYWIDVEFTAAQASGEISLGRTNIIEGSDAVIVNGQGWVRDRDYRIDYDLGKITLVRQPGPGDQVNVDYSYAPLFQQAGRTLLGSAFRMEGRDRSFGGAFMYESKGAQDLRPRLGEEPSRVFIGDLNTEWRFRPEWVTRLVDRLPGVRTTAPSEFNLTAEGGMSFPNPNTRNEVYIDDMEGVRDAVSLSMDPLRWKYASVPLRLVGLVPTPIENFAKNAELRWYSPLNAVKERDLKPALSNAQGAQNSRQVLALSLPRRPTAFPDPALQPLWAGVTYPMDAVGIDLSKAQFIDVWVSDFRDFHTPGVGTPSPRVRGRNVKLHIDLGVVSEDQMRAPNIPPDDTLSTEDRGNPGDGQLTVTDTNNEDTGVDGRINPSEAPPVIPDLTTVNGTDRNGDDFAQPLSNFNDIDPRKWDRVIGTEGNKNVYPVPDTEDLNDNGRIDRDQNFFEYTIDLGNTSPDYPYLVTDVAAEFTNYANDGRPLPLDNGWRRYRIPIGDSLRVRFGNPDLTLARHVRVWLEDVQETNAPPLGDDEQRPFVMLGGLEIAGSRWLAAPVDSSARARGTTLTLNSINTIDNADDYVAPFDPGSTVSGSQELQRREQSLAMEFTELGPDTELEVFKTFSLDEDYSRYTNMRFYVAGFDLRDGYDPATDSLSYFVRFASDEQGQNYYEFRAKVPRNSLPGLVNWQDVRIKLNDLSILKLNADFPKLDPIRYEVPGPNPGERYVIRGRPSFTRLRRISFGVINDTLATRTFRSGQMWFNEVRATEVAKDVGRAQRLLVNGRLANLLTYNVSYNGRDENFQSVGETRGSGSSLSSTSFSTTLDLHRFFEGTGIVLPLSFSNSVNSAQPRFTAGDDIVRTGVLAEASEARSTVRSYTASYSRAWGERSNPLLRYTLGGITASIGRTESYSSSPTTVDTSKSVAASVNYQIAPRRLVVLPINPARVRIYPLPERVYWNYGVATSRIRSYDRLRDSLGTQLLRNAVNGRTGSIEFGADSRPIVFGTEARPLDLLVHSFQGSRNLTLPEHLRETIGFINLGRVVRWRQTLSSRYSLDRFSTFLRPTLGWNASYQQNNGPELSPDLSLRSIQNNQAYTLTWDFPFDKMVTPRPAVAPGDTTRRASTALPWRSWLGRLGTVSLDAGLNHNSAYTRVEGSPDFFYLTGFTRDPGIEPDTTGRVRQRPGNQSIVGQDWRAGARTRLALGRGALLMTRLDYSEREATSNAVTNRTNRLSFPDLDLDYGRVSDAIGLGKFMTNPRLRTVYRRSRVTEYSNSESPTSLSTSSQWQPLLGLSGDFKNQTRAEFRIERRVTQTETRLLGQSVNTDRYTDVNLNLSRSYSRGQKVNILGKETIVKSSVSLRLSTVYSRRSGETVQTINGVQRPPQYPVENDRLSVSTGGSYGFSDNVTGSVDLGFGQTRDLQLDIVRRNVRVEVRAQFTF